MIDLHELRERRDEYQRAAQQKHINVDVTHFLKLADERRALQQEREELLHERHTIAAKGKSHQPSQADIVKGRELKEQLRQIELKIERREMEYQDLYFRVPTIPSADTPVGKDERENVEVYRSLTPPPSLPQTPKDHVTLGAELDILDMERGAVVSGYRGYYLKNEGALLQLALMHYAMAAMVAKGFTPFIPPTLVRGFALAGTGYFRRRTYDPSTDEIYKIASTDKEEDGTEPHDDRFLVGTAEPSLLAYYGDSILAEKELPLRICGFSPCYRSEIGSYGKDTRGLYRVHEFMKVEQVMITRADEEEAHDAQKEMIQHSRELYEQLELPFREVQICTGDLGAGKYRQIDTEVWIPSRNAYGETGSASNFRDWQSRRLNIRYRDTHGKKQYVFMLNNTVLASARLLIAIIENHQQADGSIRIPKILHPLMHGRTEIRQKKPRR